MIAQPSYPIRDLAVGGNDCASVAECAQVLSGIEAEGAGMSNRSSVTTAPARAMRLGSVLHDNQAPLLSQGHYGIHVGHAAVEVYRCDGARSLGQRSLRGP